MCRGVAQLVEHWSPKPGVASSSLAAPAKYSIFSYKKKSLEKETSIEQKAGACPDFLS